MSIFNSPLAKIGIGMATGGVGGAAMGALSSTNSPASRAVGMYNTGANIYGNVAGGGPQAPVSPGAMPDYGQDALGGQNFSDQLGAMGRKVNAYQFGGR